MNQILVSEDALNSIKAMAQKLQDRGNNMERVLVNIREMFRFIDEEKWENVIKEIDKALK
jgi:hypothetical protein